VRALARIERRDIGVILVYSAAVGLTSLAIPVAVQNLVNTVAFGTVIQPLIVIGIALLAFLCFAAVLRVLRFVAAEYVQRRIFVRFAVDIADRLPHVKPGTERKKYLPEYVNRFFDVMTVQKSASLLLIEGTALLLQTIIGLVLLAVYHPALAAFDLVLILGLLVVFGLLGRGASRTTLAESDSKYAVAAWLEDLAARPDLFRHPVAARQAVARADELARVYLENRRAHFRIVLRQFIGGSVLQVTANVALLLIGGWLVINGELTLGQLVAAELVVALVVAGLAKIGKLLESFYDLLAGVTKLGKLIDLPLGQKTGITLNGHANFTLNKRPLSGVIQLSCGVTARKLVDAARGVDSDASLEVNGLPLSTIRYSDRRRAVWVIDGPALVHGTVRENAMLGSNCRPARIDTVLHDFGFDVDQLELSLLPHGGPLSDIDAMALTMARAVLAEPHLLILDDVLAHMETAESRRLINVLSAARGEKPTIVITERKDLDLYEWQSEVLA
jgi:ABC-type bacteriocin/lantibiotic exporter with double-glycine peptidase domain